MKKIIFFNLLFLISSLIWAQNRYALVIGNSNYPAIENRLPNAKNDSQDISMSLKDLKFNVVLRQDLKRLEMMRDIDAFINRLRSSPDSEGFFWYAGHGCEIDGEVFLMPLDVDASDDFSIKNTSYSMNKIKTDLAKIHNKVNIIVLDACRDTPGDEEQMTHFTFTSSDPYGFDLKDNISRRSRSIQRVNDVPADMLIIYSTSPGTRASDGAVGKRNSPFAEAFLEYIKSTEPLTIILGDITNRTLLLTNNTQLPWNENRLRNTRYSLNNSVSPQPQPPNPQPPNPTPPAQTGFKYEIIADNVVITGYTGTSQTVTIPERIQNLPVTTIAEKAFKDNKTLKSIIIPSSITLIANNVFEGCENLTNISLPSTIIYIGSSAFWSCKNLTNITIPSSITIINPYTFYNCNNLTNITIPSSVTTIEYSAFSRCSKLTNITIPSSVSKIGTETFKDCSSLTNINVDNNNANFSSLDGVLFDKNKQTIICYPSGKKENTYTIPSTVINIGYGAFYNCSSLTNITIPSTVTNIASHAFYNCSSLTNITIPSTVTNIGSSAFSFCNGLTNIIIPSSVKIIDSHAFSYCDNLTNITISSSVTTIGDNAFSRCKKLTNITIPSSVTKIGLSVFENCNSLINIYVDNNNANFSSLEGVLFDKNKQTIICYPSGKKENAYTIPSTVINIASHAFYYCSSLTNITIPSTVTNIGSYAFSFCDGLTNIIIPSSVKTIDSYAFSYCKNLKTITIPSSVTTIGNNAFRNNNNLTNATISRRTKLGTDVFPSSTTINYSD
jgi:hypothetical protein